MSKNRVILFSYVIAVVALYSLKLFATEDSLTVQADQNESALIVTEEIQAPADSDVDAQIKLIAEKSLKQVEINRKAEPKKNIQQAVLPEPEPARDPAEFKAASQLIQVPLADEKSESRRFILKFVSSLIVLFSIIYFLTQMNEA